MNLSTALGAAASVTLVLAAFALWGPDPHAVADAALARATAKVAQPVQDPDGVCPVTAAAHTGGTGGTLVCRRDAAAGRLTLVAARAPQAGMAGRLDAARGGGDTISTPAHSVPLPGPSSLVGPLAAVALVLALRRAALGLFLAVIAGAIAAMGPVAGLRAAAVDVFWPTLTNTDNLLILAFTATMLGMVHVAMAAGGFTDLARRVAAGAGAHAEGARRRTRMATWLLGLVVFFDDYANSLVVGSSLRPLADRTGVSRAKLAYLVDATSAAVAGVAIVSTWVGFEVGLLQDQIARFDGIATAGYGVFMAALPYRFYCVLTIVFAGLIAWTGRDFGPMAKAEAQARAATPTADAAPGRAHWGDALLPVLVVVATVVGADLALGWSAGGGLLTRFIAGAESAGLKVLAAAGAAGSLAAVVGAVARRLLSPAQALSAWAAGVRAMAPVLAILVSAMAMRVVCELAGTPGYLAALLGGVHDAWVPVLSFFVAAVVASMTGSSWATMGILLPIVVPLAARAPGPEGIWLLAATAAVLDGAIFGDHCSPISDTTVMSSAASGCPHDQHVLTQLPYALTVMVAAAGFGYLGSAWLEIQPWWVLPPAALALALFLRLVGTRAPSPTTGS